MPGPRDPAGGAEAPPRHRERLWTDGVEVHFDGVKAIDGVALEVSQGEILGLIGPNGAGKTTLVNVITGFQPPDAGSVGIGDEEITAWSTPRRARAGVARTFQGARLFDRLTVFENVEAGAVASGLSPRAARQRAAALLEFFRLGPLANTEAGALSHGMARRLGVARGLSSNPSFLLLDEPAAGLDETESVELVELLREVHEHYSLGLVVIEHDVPLIMSLCDRVHVLDHGQTLAVGAPDEISADSTVITAYLGAADEGEAGAGEKRESEASDAEG